MLDVQQQQVSILILLLLHSSSDIECKPFIERLLSSFFALNPFPAARKLITILSTLLFIHCPAHEASGPYWQWDPSAQWQKYVSMLILELIPYSLMLICKLLFSFCFSEWIKRRWREGWWGNERRRGISMINICQILVVLISDCFCIHSPPPTLIFLLFFFFLDDYFLFHLLIHAFPASNDNPS